MTEIAAGMKSPYEEDDANTAMELLSNLSEEQIADLLGTWAAKDIADASDSLTAVGMKEGEGITTPGKYGVYVANPMGAFGAGLKRGYGTTNKMVEALRNRDIMKGLAKKEINPLEYMP
jgi:hypothetical protein